MSPVRLKIWHTLPRTIFLHAAHRIQRLCSFLLFRDTLTNTAEKSSSTIQRFLIIGLLSRTMSPNSHLSCELSVLESQLFFPFPGHYAISEGPISLSGVTAAPHTGRSPLTLLTVTSRLSVLTNLWPFILRALHNPAASSLCICPTLILCIYAAHTTLVLALWESECSAGKPPNSYTNTLHIFSSYRTSYYVQLLSYQSRYSDTGLCGMRQITTETFYFRIWDQRHS